MQSRLGFRMENADPCPQVVVDFIARLPLELAVDVLKWAPFDAVVRARRVSKLWNSIISSDTTLWKELLSRYNLWLGGDSETLFVDAVKRRRLRQKTMTTPHGLTLEEPYSALFKTRFMTRGLWNNNKPPFHIAFPVHGRSAVTCLLLDEGRIISASETSVIQVHSVINGAHIHSLRGHDNGVWALASANNTLVSGSIDRTVRIWNLITGRCTHVFGGHTATIRCIVFAMPEQPAITERIEALRSKDVSERPLIITGSRDGSLRVWALPPSADIRQKGHLHTTADTLHHYVMGYIFLHRPEALSDF
ncbi:unnamed protein product [Peniophora sp. CBMAI 1063]|nr:unnamed protein product [Peniophora sp. CBMAI 1063]